MISGFFFLRRRFSLTNLSALIIIIHVMMRAARFDEQRLSGNPRRSAAGSKVLVNRKIQSSETGPSIQTSSELGFWMEGKMNTAARVREAKEANPKNFCPNSHCLWRTVTRDGFKPCPKHMEPEKSGEQLLTDAIRHIQRLHMNCRTWTLPAGDDDAITLMRDVRATHRAYTPLCG